jgi:hypothetical protein
MRAPQRWLAVDELGDEERTRAPGAGDEVRLAGGVIGTVQATTGKYTEWGVWTVELSDGALVDVIATREIQLFGALWEQVVWGAIGPRYASR